MKIFKNRAEFEVIITYFTKVSDDVEANRLNHELATNLVNLIKKDGRYATVKKTMIHVGRAPEDARLSTFTCGGCGAQTLKEEWGAGRITCPRCGRVAQKEDAYP